MLKDQVGLPGIALLLLGLWSIRSAPHMRQMVEFPLIFFLFMGSFKVYFSRSLLPLLPAIAILMSLGFQAFARKATGVRWGFLVCLLPATVIAVGLLGVFREREELTRVEQAHLAAMEWAHINLPPGTRIAREWFGPPFNQWPSGVQYHVETTPLAMIRKVEQLQALGFSYVVESGMYELLLENPASRDPTDVRCSIREEHERLRRLFSPVAEFGHIRFYRIEASDRGSPDGQL
jgi:hypothetical protein